MQHKQCYHGQWAPRELGEVGRSRRGAASRSLLRRARRAPSSACPRRGAGCGRGCGQLCMSICKERTAAQCTAGAAVNGWASQRPGRRSDCQARGATGGQQRCMLLPLPLALSRLAHRSALHAGCREAGACACRWRAAAVARAPQRKRRCASGPLHSHPAGALQWHSMLEPRSNCGSYSRVWHHPPVTYACSTRTKRSIGVWPRASPAAAHRSRRAFPPPPECGMPFVQRV